MFARVPLLTVLIFLLVAISLLSVKIHAQSSLKGIDLFSSCDKIIGSKKAIECYTNIMLAQVKKNPANTKNLLNALYKKSLGPNFSGHANLHKIAHEAGELMATLIRDPYEGFFSCGPEFDGACYHAVVMTYADEAQPLDDSFSFEKAFQFCEGVRSRSSSGKDYSNCIHGVGHIGIIKVKGDINKALGECDSLETAFRSHCYDGVFMEYSRGDFKTGLHIHVHAIGSIILPCKDLDVVYKATCYKSMGRGNPAFFKNREDYYGGAQFCDSIEKDYQIYCRLGLGRRMLLSTGYDMQQAASICANLGKYSDDCKQAIILNKVYNIEQWQDPNEFCQQLPRSMISNCLQSEVAYYNFILP